ncbi:MAG TPA: hypothetical protein DCR24_15695, partial [Bacillus bacterium]|nr:hypothetical protein [Bacillus sp. (in: firmicutes)]
MKWVLIAILLLTVLVIIIFITKVKIYLDYYHGMDNDHLKVTLKAWGGLIKYKVEVPVIKIDDDSPTIVAEQKVKTGPNENPAAEKVIQEDKS